MNHLTYNGISSAGMGIAISGEGSFDAPARDVSTVSIPGRNGDLILDNGRYKNQTVKYPALVQRDFAASAGAVRLWLLGPGGYRTLADSYHPDEYRLAVYSGGISFDTWPKNHAATFTMSFNCKPQRFLVSGADTIKLANGGSLTNPTGMAALPLIRVECQGNGELTVGGTLVTLTGVDGEITLDCDLQDAFSGLQSLNQQMSGSFPVLGAGETVIHWSGGISGVEIVPRWWRI